jgi:BRCA1-associated protein
MCVRASPLNCDSLLSTMPLQFCLLEPDLLCRLVFVRSMDIDDSATGIAENHPTAAIEEDSTTIKNDRADVGPPGTTELPSCPVCLERLDEHVSGIVTTVCNHRFHSECLRRWGDASCPVCRYCQSPAGAASTSRCSTCAASHDLWVCLICGHVGCGRYRGSHAAEHFQSSGHGYALELETQRVWDYVNDAYVHRLVRSKTDGKLVEVTAPTLARGGDGCGGQEGCSAAAGAGGACSAHGEGCCVEADPKMEEALVASKLDAMALEYNHLLVSQLESQRQHFEGVGLRARAEGEAAAAVAERRAAEAERAAASARAAEQEVERRRRALESRIAEMTAKLDKSEEERKFLKELNDSLLSNQRDFALQLKAAEAAAAAKDAEARDLSEQVRDLMVFIEARQTIVEGGGELEGGTVLPVPAPARRGRKKR